jgi:hypothetical protein
LRKEKQEIITKMYRPTQIRPVKKAESTHIKE